MGADNGASETFDLGSLYSAKTTQEPFKFTYPRRASRSRSPTPKDSRSAPSPASTGSNPVEVLEELLGRPVAGVPDLRAGDVAATAPAGGLGQALRDRLGGIVGLAALLEQSGTAVEADLRETYGVRLSDLYSRSPDLARTRCPGPRTTRRVYGPTVPSQASTTTGPAPNSSSPGIYDMLQVIDWHYVTAHSKHPPRKPEPIERPGVEKTRLRGRYPHRRDAASCCLASKARRDEEVRSNGS